MLYLYMGTPALHINLCILHMCLTLPPALRWQAVPVFLMQLLML
jgi:hypothetical protein